MPTRKAGPWPDEATASADDEVSAAKQAKLLRAVFTERAAFEGWLLRHPRGFAAAIGLCGEPQRFFETVANSVKQSRSKRVAKDRSQEERVAKKNAKRQFSSISELGSNFPWDGAIGLLNEVRAARLQNAILIPLLGQALELQSLTGRAHKQGFRADLKPGLDKAANLVQAALSDIATQNIEAAKKNLKAVEAAVQAIRGSIEG
jgi:hypothetical protein